MAADVADPEEAAPLLASGSQRKPDYATIPKDVEEKWEPPRGFWWIETALWANVFLSGFDGTITASTYALISSDFNAANNASWLTTSYLITSTAFQPLYGRFSDIFGRRVCFLVSTVAFMLGCLGCSMAQSMLMLDLMRALTGFGGGGLITMATVINSDMIPFRQRGMYQSMQNIFAGLGAVLGASLGGVIAQYIGWRWCFLLQVPVSLLALAVGYRVLENSSSTILEFASEGRYRHALKYLDLQGASILIVGLAAQLVGLGFGGNNYPWKSVPVIGSLVLSVLLLAGFVAVEATTDSIPVVPLRMLHGLQPVAVQLTNVFSGMAAYAYLFTIPLYFQAVRGQSPAEAGLKLMIPSFATPVGGIVAGMLMQRGIRLSYNVRVGTSMMLLGNFLATTMGMCGCWWTDFVYLVPANVGLGLTNPSVLFSFVSLFEHRDQAVATSTVYLIRSLGTIYGVTITAAIVQNILLAKLPAALGVAASPELIEKLRSSVFAISQLPPAEELAVRSVYFEALRISFATSTAFAFLSFVFSWTARTGSLRRR